MAFTTFQCILFLYLYQIFCTENRGLDTLWGHSNNMFLDKRERVAYLCANNKTKLKWK